MWVRRRQGSRRQIAKKRHRNRFAIRRARARILEKTGDLSSDRHGYIRYLFYDKLRLTIAQSEELAFFLIASGVTPRAVERWFDMAHLLGYAQRRAVLFVTRNFY